MGAGVALRSAPQLWRKSLERSLMQRALVIRRLGWSVTSRCPLDQLYVGWEWIVCVLACAGYEDDGIEQRSALAGLVFNNIHTNVHHYGDIDSHAQVRRSVDVQQRAHHLPRSSSLCCCYHCVLVRSF